MPGRPVAPRPAATAAGRRAAHRRRLGLPPRLAPTDLAVRAGEALAVTGPNGAGKSTLALLLGGLLKPGTGRLTASRRAGRAGRRHGTAPLAGRRAGPPDRLGLPEPGAPVPHRHRPRRAGARSAPDRSPEAAVRSTVDELLTRLRLDRLADANPYTLSGGEARRLSVATALATAPRLLVLDEPTFGQDRRTWIELVDLLAELRDGGHGVVTVTHDADFVAALADRTVTLPGRDRRRSAGTGRQPAAPRDSAWPSRPAHRERRRDHHRPIGRRPRRWPGATRSRNSPPRWSSRSP